MKLDQILKSIQKLLKRSEPLLMVKFPTPPGRPRPRGYEMERIHPFMSQVELSRAASAILMAMEDKTDIEIEREYMSRDAGSGLWDKHGPYGIYSEPEMKALRQSNGTKLVIA